MSFKKDVLSCIKDVIAEQITPEDIKNQIIECICNMNFRDKINDALESAIEENIDDYIESTIEEAVCDFVAQELEEIFS